MPRSPLAMLIPIRFESDIRGNSERVMKCSNPSCSHGIGLVSYGRGWFNKRRFCSKKCRDDFKIERPELRQQEQGIGGSNSRTQPDMETPWHKTNPKNSDVLNARHVTKSCESMQDRKQAIGGCIPKFH